MIQVFLSRPTWVRTEFQRGLDGFLRLLRSLDVEPRTLGATDYPTQAPMRAVIELMDQCSGAIILGYPQIEMDRGRIRDKQRDKVLLATEWNHIEAGLAYARGLPLLLIHHTGVIRGVFDRGTTDSFIYDKDLANPGWPLEDDVNGAMRDWKARVLDTTPGRETREINDDHEDPLPDGCVTVMVFLWQQDPRVTLATLSDELEIEPQRAIYWLATLIERGYVSRGEVLGHGIYYQLTQHGRRYLNDNNLV